MSFLQPLGLLGLIAVPIIIIIYLIKARYVQKPVSSTFIWKRSLKYIKRKIPMSVILSLLLIIQILTVVTASLAISRPTIKPLKSNETILILDASASMQTTDGGEQTRFDRGIEKVLEHSDSIGPNSKLSLIIANEKPVAITDVNGNKRFSNKVDFELAIDNLQCSDYEARVDDEGKDDNIKSALELAADILKENSEAKIKLITDKNYAVTENVEVINVSNKTEKNLVVKSLSDKILPTKNYEYTAYVTCYGFADENGNSTGMECTIVLTVDGVHCGLKNIQVPSATSDIEELEVIFTPNRNRVADGEGQVIVHIDNEIKSYEEAKVELTAKDGIQSDNVGYVFMQETITPKIMLVSRFLQTKSDGSVDSTKSTTLLAALTSNGYYVKGEDMYTKVTDEMVFSGYDLYIFEGVDIPGENIFPTDGAVWILNPTSIPANMGITLGNVKHDVSETKEGFAMYKSTESQDETVLSPAFKTITNKIVKNAVLGSYTEMTLTGGNYEAIFLCDTEANSPALLAGSHTTKEGSVRTIVTSFDFRSSNWAYLVTDYTLLISNLMKYSIPNALGERDFTVGETVVFNAPPGANKITLKYGETAVKTLEGGIEMSFELTEVGVYEVVVEFAKDSGKEDRVYKLPTHISENESDISRMDEGELVAPVIIGGKVAEPDPIEIFPYLIGLLLLLLVVEWGVYHRDGF